MNKKLWIVFSIVVVLVVVSILAFNFTGVDFYSKEAGGNIYAEDYDEKYKVLESIIEVDGTKLNKLIITSFVDLNQGDLKYELYDPNGSLVNQATISSKEVFKETTNHEPVFGKWVAKYYINELTDGSYNLRLEGK